VGGGSIQIRAAGRAGNLEARGSEKSGTAQAPFEVAGEAVGGKENRGESGCKQGREDEIIPT